MVHCSMTEITQAEAMIYRIVLILISMFLRLEVLVAVHQAAID